MATIHLLHPGTIMFPEPLAAFDVLRDGYHVVHMPESSMPIAFTIAIDGQDVRERSTVRIVNHCNQEDLYVDPDVIRFAPSRMVCFHGRPVIAHVYEEDGAVVVEFLPFYDGIQVLFASDRSTFIKLALSNHYA